MHEASGFSYGSIVITMWIWATLYQIAYIDQVFFPPEEYLSQQVIYIDRYLALALIIHSRYLPFPAPFET